MSVTYQLRIKQGDSKMQKTRLPLREISPLLTLEEKRTQSTRGNEENNEIKRV